MDKLIRQYLSKFKCAVIIDINEYMNIAFNLKNEEIKYILLDTNWRLLVNHKMVLTKSSLNEIQDLKKHINGLKVKRITISRFSDLTIELEQGVVLQIIADSMKYENWVINQDIICLPGGELTHSLFKEPKTV
ncbi:hypothetical protein [Paracholeplasma manati]|uniref:Uncharacterized protein n=1 Tax=Paracholeplasma manati TaxID=591373 RepID=A0ABT2Y3N7_9MOLU|nr:hypothetical protein [Paracholeplasma manati]MCV2231355.1 hypothetical protein [Paracholeplasma manati]MDG0888435.1 hypothetical protein [Paracholeplasma manati]